MSVPRVSIVIPTYNRRLLLKETLDSVMAQSYTDFEVLVIDDGSDDGTREMVTGISDPRIRYDGQAHSGLPAAGRNRGIRISRGAWIAFLDSDDLWLPDKLEKQLQLNETRPDIGLFYSMATTIGHGNDQVPTIPYRRMRSGHVFEDLFYFNFIPTLTVLVRRATLDHVGLFDERPDFKAIEDYDLWLRIAHDYPVLCLPLVTARYRNHEGKLTVKLPDLYSRQELVLAKIFQEFRVSPSLQNRTYAFLAIARFRQSVQIPQDSPESSARWIRQAVQLSPCNIRARFYQLGLLFFGCWGFCRLAQLKRFFLDPAK